MTAATAARADGGVLPGPERRPLGIWTASLQQAWNKHRAYRATLAELKDLSDRQLSDVGTSRATLERFVRGNVYGN